MGTTRRSFTLIELLIVIGIISILIGVLVPSMSRSLSGNRLASDVEVLRAKIEETRLLAGSTQISDEEAGVDLRDNDRVAYYGVLIPSEDMITNPNNVNGKPFYAIVRLSRQLLAAPREGYCDASTMINEAITGNGSCIVERVDLTNGISLDSSALPGQRVIGFKVPSQQIVELCRPPRLTNQQPHWTCDDPNNNDFTWKENPAGPLFNQTNGENAPYIKLRYNNKKKADITVEKYTGKLIVQYGTM